MSTGLLALGATMAALVVALVLPRLPSPAGARQVVAMSAQGPQRRARTLMTLEGPRTGRGGRQSGERHLMVGLRLGPDSLRVSSVAVAPGRPPQLVASRHPWLAATTRHGEVVHLSRVPDPFGDSRPVLRDSGSTVQGRVVVAIPFRTPAELAETAVHILRLPEDFKAFDPDALAHEVRRRLASSDGVRSLGFAAVEAAPHWATVGPLLGLTVDPARFEVFRDTNGEWRWRLRRAGGAIVAAGSTGHAARTDAEAELAWVRQHAAGSPTTVLD